MYSRPFDDFILWFSLVLGNRLLLWSLPLLNKNKKCNTDFFEKILKQYGVKEKKNCLVPFLLYATEELEKKSAFRQKCILYLSIAKVCTGWNV